MNIASKFPNKPKLWIIYKQFQIIKNTLKYRLNSNQMFDLHKYHYKHRSAEYSSIKLSETNHMGPCQIMGCSVYPLFWK